jgi:hypothetical protein
MFFYETMYWNWGRKWCWVHPPVPARGKKKERNHTLNFGSTGVWTQDFALARQVLYHFMLEFWYIYIYFFIFCSTGIWTQGLHLEPPHQPFFVMGFFEIGSCELFAWGWLWTVILLISASWVAGITGVSHRHLAELWSFSELVIFGTILSLDTAPSGKNTQHSRWRTLEAFFSFFFFVALRMVPRVSCVLYKGCTTKLLPQHMLNTFST